MSTKTQLITTFEEACEAKGIEISKLLLTYENVPHEHTKPLLAHSKLLIIAEVLNDGWKPDWNNDDEYKYYPWWDMEKTEDNPSGFSLYYVNCVYTYSIVGSRLCFKSRSLAEHAAEHFIDLYRDMLTY
jgi:hypothetical protein